MIYFLKMTVREMDYSVASAVSFSAFISENNIQLVLRAIHTKRLRIQFIYHN